MGLNIYAGTLTRYYNHNWQIAEQPFAVNNSFENKKLLLEREHYTPYSAEEVISHICKWRDGMIKGLLQVEPVFEPWEENNENPYYAERIGWDAFGALVVYSAFRMLKGTAPETIESGVRFLEHPVVAAVKAKEGFWNSLFCGVSIWLPFSVPIKFMHMDPSRNKMPLSTINALLLELNAINESGWNADEKTILSWAETEGYPVGADIGNELYKRGLTHEEYNLESLAKYAFSVLYQAAHYAQKNNVPLKMDF